VAAVLVRSALGLSAPSSPPPLLFFRLSLPPPPSAPATRGPVLVMSPARAVFHLANPDSARSGALHTMDDSRRLRPQLKRGDGRVAPWTTRTGREPGIAETGRHHRILEFLGSGPAAPAPYGCGQGLEAAACAATTRDVEEFVHLAVRSPPTHCPGRARRAHEHRGPVTTCHRSRTHCCCTLGPAAATLSDYPLGAITSRNAPGVAGDLATATWHVAPSGPCCRRA